MPESITPTFYLAGILGLGVAAQWLAWRMRLPAIVLLLGFGFAVGQLVGPPDNFIDEKLLFPLVSLAVGVILFEGGLSLRFREVHDTGGVVARLVTIGLGITWMLSALAGLRPGRYRARGVIEAPRIVEGLPGLKVPDMRDVDIEVEVTVSGDGVVFDLSGTNPQVRAPWNAPYSVTLSAVYFALRAVTDPSIPPNHGCYLPVEVVCPQGSLLNPEPPHPVGAGNVETSQILAGVCLEAFGHATPEGARNLVSFARKIVDEAAPATGRSVKLDWHGHRDRGLSVANALAAIDAGVDRVHATALGIGERSGNTPIFGPPAILWCSCARGRCDLAAVVILRNSLSAPARVIRNPASDPRALRSYRLYPVELQN